MGPAAGEVQPSAALGVSRMAGGLAKAPFDTLGDTLRGTQGIMMDMFQRRTRYSPPWNASRPSP